MRWMKINSDFSSTIPEVWHSKNTLNKSCFKSRNKCLKINIIKSYWKFTIPKLASKKCTLKSTVMNKEITNSYEKTQDVEKGQIWVRHLVSFVSLGIGLGICITLIVPLHILFFCWVPGALWCTCNICVCNNPEFIAHNIPSWYIDD